MNWSVHIISLTLLFWALPATAVRVTLRWAQVKSAQSYEIEINGQNNNWNLASNTNSLATDLPAGIFNYRIRAVDRMQRSGVWSNRAVLTVPPANPETILPNVETIGVAAFPHAMELEWKTSGDGVEYALWWNSMGESPQKVVSKTSKWKWVIPKPGRYQIRLKSFFPVYSSENAAPSLLWSKKETAVQFIVEKSEPKPVQKGLVTSSNPVEKPGTETNKDLDEVEQFESELKLDPSRFALGIAGRWGAGNNLTPQYIMPLLNIENWFSPKWAVSFSSAADILLVNKKTSFLPDVRLASNYRMNLPELGLLVFQLGLGFQKNAQILDFEVSSLGPVGGVSFRKPLDNQWVLVGNLGFLVPLKLLSSTNGSSKIIPTLNWNAGIELRHFLTERWGLVVGFDVQEKRSRLDSANDVTLLGYGPYLQLFRTW